MELNIDEIAKKVAQCMIGRIDANMDTYAEGFDEGDLIDTCLDEVLEGNIKHWLYEKVSGHPEVEAAISACEDNIRDWKSDQDLWKDGPMKAYGLKESDFV